jgi:hypothetical protein
VDECHVGDDATTARRREMAVSRASDQLHKDRMYAKGWKALILSGLTPAQAHKSMRALIASIGRACPVCTYGKITSLQTGK